MNMEKPSLRKIIDANKETLESARNKTSRSSDRKHKYPVTDSGIDAHNYEYFPEKGGMVDYVKQKLVMLSENEKFRILDYGCGENCTLRELKNQLGNQSDKVELLGASAGDPRKHEDEVNDKEKGIGFLDLKSPSTELAKSNEEKYDLIISIMTFMHLPDPLRVIKQLYSALAIGGEMRIDWKITSTLIVDKDGHNYYTIAEKLLKLLTDQGIEIETFKNGMIIRKKDDKPLKLPVEYADVAEYNESGDWNVFYKLKD